MDEHLDRVKDQLEELDKALDEMKDDDRSRTEPINDQKKSEYTDNDSKAPTDDTGTAQTSEKAAEMKEAPGEERNDQDGPDSSTSSDDPHPSPLERFRNKLDHGHEAADQKHFHEAQKIYRSLIQEYRGLKHRDKLTDKDEKRLHTLYEKVDRAKE